MAPNLRQLSVMNAAAHQVVVEQDAVRRKYFFQPSPMDLIGDDKGSLEHRLHLLEPRGGKLGIERYVKASCVHDTPERAEICHALFHVYGYGLSFCQGQGEGGANAPTGIQGLGECDGLSFVYQSGFVRELARALFQIFQDVCHSLYVSYGLSGGVPLRMCYYGG